MADVPDSVTHYNRKPTFESYVAPKTSVLKDIKLLAKNHNNLIVNTIGGTCMTV